MLWNEIVSSICICCSATIFSLSLQGRTKNKMLLIQMFSSILYITSYMVVVNVNSAALVGGITAIFEAIRLIVFYFIEKNEKFNTPKINLIAMIAFSVILSVCIFIAWGGWISVLPLVSGIVVSLALGCKNMTIIKVSFVVQALLITAYLFMLHLWINALSQIFVFVFSVIGLITYIRGPVPKKRKKF